MQNFLDKSRKFAGSRWCFYLIVALFGFSSLWIALSGHYPMAFDENYHYGIIQQYSRQLSPFFSHPPAYSEALGDITRYPSYLFHYLMSFPYRLISIFVTSDVLKIVSLRLLNILLLGSSFIIFKQIFDKLRIGKATGNLALLFFALTPVVPFLGAQINYDNLLIPLTALAILIFTVIADRLKRGKLDIGLSCWLLVLCLLASLVKYTFLPIFFVLAVSGVLLVLKASRQQANFKIGTQLTQGIKKLGMAAKLLAVVGLFLSLGLFVERYGVNIVKYHTPVPECDQVLSERSCLQYGPWARDYYLVHSKTGPPSWNAARYSGHWAAQNLHELFFAIDQNYLEQSPLPLPYCAAWLFGLTGFILMLVNWRKLRRLPHLNLVVLMIIFYVGVLWLDNYHRFLTVNWPVAIHGRYLLPLLPLIYALLAYAYRISFNQYQISAYVKVALMTGAIVCMSQGGLVTYIVRSSDSWAWDNSVVKSVNTKARSGLDVVPH